MRVLVNAVIARGNSGGGATQIVVNFIRASITDTEIEWYYVISQELKVILDQCEIYPKNSIVVPRQPQFKSYFKTNRLIQKYIRENSIDLVYSILAPSYFFFRIPEVMRCCNAWDVIDKTDLAFSFIDKKTYVRFRLKTLLVRSLMKRASCIITQTQKAKSDILKFIPKNTKVDVIPNVLPLFFKGITPQREGSGYFDIVYLASPAPHKNIEIVPKVAYLLKEKYNIQGFRFVLTIPEKMSHYWGAILSLSKSYGVEENVINVGAKSQAELVTLYNQSSLGFFPSVLETFSATLLEYMYFGLPVVSSDREFNKEILSEKGALYFNPFDAEKAAENICAIINDSQLRDCLISEGRKRIANYSSYERHFMEIKQSIIGCK